MVFFLFCLCCSIEKLKLIENMVYNIVFGKNKTTGRKMTGRNVENKFCAIRGYDEKQLFV
jgi:hypothetical protein